MSLPANAHVTRAALLVEIGGKLRQVVMTNDEALMLVNIAQAFGDGKLRVTDPIESITLHAPATCTEKDEK